VELLEEHQKPVLVPPEDTRDLRRLVRVCHEDLMTRVSKHAFRPDVPIRLMRGAQHGILSAAEYESTLAQ
jgi:hypothetical protein